MIQQFYSYIPQRNKSMCLYKVLYKEVYSSFVIIIAPKWKELKFSSKRRADKQLWFSQIRNATHQLKKKQKQTTDVSNNMDKSQSHFW